MRVMKGRERTRGYSEVSLCLSTAVVVIVFVVVRVIAVTTLKGLESQPTPFVDIRLVVA